MLRLTSFAVIVILVLAGCSSMEITSDYDAELAPSFPAYRTYAWLKQEANFVEDGKHVRADLAAKRIRTAINVTLAEKGYEQLSSGSADFLVGYHVALHGKIETSNINNYYGYGWGHWHGSGGGVVHSESYTREFTEGALVIDIVDGAKNELAWRGSARAEVKRQENPEKSQQRIDEAVRKILATFPPE
jgi:hypothetical protein